MKTVLSNIPAIVWWLLGGVLLLKILVGVLRWKRVRGGDWGVVCLADAEGRIAGD